MSHLPFIDRRMSTDKTHTELRSLIMETEAPKDKATLLIMLKISESLAENTDLTQNLSEKVDGHMDRYTAHETREAVLVGQAKTAWFILSGVLVLVQGVALYAIKSYIDDYRALNDRVSVIRRDLDTVTERWRLENDIRRSQK